MSTTIENVARDIEERIAVLTQELNDKRQAFRRETEADEEELRRLSHAHAQLTGQAVEPAGKSNGRSTPRRPRGQNRQDILAVVRERPGVSPVEVAQATGIQKNVVYTTLTKMTEAGEVAKVNLPGDERAIGYKLP
jgi:hypothetical protein